jgi:hypothetical protein
MLTIYWIQQHLVLCSTSNNRGSTAGSLICGDSRWITSLKNGPHFARQSTVHASLL